MNKKEFIEREFEIAKKVVCHHLENNYLSINDMPQHNNGLIARRND